MNRLVKFLGMFFLVFGLVSWCSPVQAAQSLGMVTRLSGAAGYIGADKGGEKALKPFMKLFKGDAVDLKAGAGLQIVYFDTGRKVDYKGPAKIVVGQEGGSPGSESSESSVSVMPDVVAKEVKRIASIIDPSRLQYAGAAVVRGTSGEDEEPLPPVELEPSEQREIDLARNMYDSLLEKADPHDITPELFLFSVMADFDQFEEMNSLIAKMEKKQPENPTIDQLSQWMKDQM